MLQQFLTEGWQLRKSGEELKPEVVPGTVYTDLLRNGNM